MKRIATLALTLIAVVAAMAAEKATVYFKVSPAMACQNCENKIKTNLRYEKGVKEIATSLCDQIVTVAYDPAKTSPEKLAASFKKIGYTATVTDKAPAGAKCPNGNAACTANTACDKNHHNCDKKHHHHNCNGTGHCTK